MTKIIDKIIKSEILYSLVFFCLYLSVFVNLVTGIYFILGFLYVYFFTISYKTLSKLPFLISLFYITPLILGFFVQGTFSVVGFLIGTSVAAFVLLNRNLVNIASGNSKFTNIALVGQVGFSFFYFFNLVIQDIRGRNKLDNYFVTIGIVVFIFATSFIFPLIFKFVTKFVDNLSFANIFLIISILITTGSLYSAFIEVGSFNTILPVSFIFGVASLIYFFTHTQNSHFKFKRTISTILYSAVPLIFTIYYPWNISKFLGSMFAALASITLFSLSFMDTNKDFRFRVTGLNTFIVNIYLFLVSLFFLSSKGIITKINIAEINYLIAVLFGIVLVMMFEELRESSSLFIKNLRLENIYSVLLIGIAVIIVYITLDLGGVETLGSLLFGVIGYLFIKNNFFAYKLAEKDKEYVYLENNLLNLLTVFSLSLILTKL